MPNACLTMKITTDIFANAVTVTATMGRKAVPKSKIIIPKELSPSIFIFPVLQVFVLSNQTLLIKL